MEAHAQMVPSMGPGAISSGHGLESVVAQLSPAIKAAVLLRNHLSTITIFLFLRSYLLANLAFSISQTIALYVFLVTRSGASRSWSLSAKAISELRRSRVIRRVYRSMEREFRSILLGHGYSIIMLMFWPGWWVVGGISLTVWQLCA